MLALRFLVSCLFIGGTYGFIQKFFNFWNNCNPPQTLVGKLCAMQFYNDPDENGIISSKDYEYDMLTYHWDDDLCNLGKWEVVNTWSCRYGYSTDYARWVYPQWDLNSDGIVNRDDISLAPLNTFTRADFLTYLYTGLKGQYCGQTEPRTDPLDIKLCAEVNALKPEDLKCN